jgi:FHS family Na+ dependent glucose MFS transporter 1
MGGHFYDRRAGHPVLVAALLLATLSLALVPVQHTLLFLGGVVLLLGLADGVIDVGSNTMMLFRFGDRARPYLNGMHFAFGAGAFIAPFFVAHSLAATGHVKWAHWLPCLAMLPLVWLLLRLPSPPVPAKREGDGEVTVRWRRAIPVILIFFLYSGAECSFGTWVYEYARAAGLADEAGAALLTSLFWGCLAGGRLLAVPVSRRFSAFQVMAANLAGCLLAAGAVLAFPASAAVLWACAAMLGLSMASFFPTLITIAAPHLASNGQLSGRVTSLFFGGAGLGVMTLPWVIGMGFEARGPGFAMLVIFASVVAMGILFLGFDWVVLRKQEPVLGETGPAL